MARGRVGRQIAVNDGGDLILSYQGQPESLVAIRMRMRIELQDVLYNKTTDYLLAKNRTPSPSAIPINCALFVLARMAIAFLRSGMGRFVRADSIGGSVISRNVRMVFSWPVVDTFRE